MEYRLSCNGFVFFSEMPILGTSVIGNASFKLRHSPNIGSLDKSCFPQPKCDIQHRPAFDSNLVCDSSGQSSQKDPDFPPGIARRNSHQRSAIETRYPSSVNYF